MRAEGGAVVLTFCWRHSEHAFTRVHFPVPDSGIEYGHRVQKIIQRRLKIRQKDELHGTYHLPGSWVVMAEFPGEVRSITVSYFSDAREAGFRPRGRWALRGSPMPLVPRSFPLRAWRFAAAAWASSAWDLPAENCEGNGGRVHRFKAATPERPRRIVSCQSPRKWYSKTGAPLLGLAYQARRNSTLHRERGRGRFTLHSSLFSAHPCLATPGLHDRKREWY